MSKRTSIWGLALVFAVWGFAAQPGAHGAPSRATQSAPGGVAAKWNFKLKKFVIGGWWGPGATDAELKLYRDAGFNVVMCGRYMELDDYGNPNSALREMDMARKHGLDVMFDTYTRNNRPWGGIVGPVDPHPTHHPSSLAELKWLYGKIGHHPALAGFLIGDDQGSVSPRAAECTQFLFEQPGPKLMPWLCGWIAPDDLARRNNPIEDPQIYPTLYGWDRTAEAMARDYCASYAGTSRRCQELGVLFWPMFNASKDTNGDASKPGYIPTDSLLRFPAYAAVAYGAQGIWYFTYNGGSLERLGTYHTEKEAKAALTPLYPVASTVNHRIAAWGPRLMGRYSPGLFGTAFTPPVEWPFPGEAGVAASPLALSPPGPGKLIESMSPDLLAGVLTAPGKSPLVMVVDCRTSKLFGDLPVRQATVQFHPGTGIRILNGDGGSVSHGSEVRLSLEPGGGQLLEVQGQGIASLCTPQAIAAAPAVGLVQNPERTVSAEELAHAKQARLRIDIFGSDSRPPYDQKYIELNGHRIGKVPANEHDSWSLAVVALTAKQLGWLKKENQITVRTEGGDAWKFRNLDLAVQLENGEWVRTLPDPTIHSSPNWAFSEGTTWGADGIAGPVALTFR